MTRGTHTPGNWSFDEGSGEVTSDIDEHGFVVCTVESNDADGPVLAASARMLKACRQALIDVLSRGTLLPDTIAELRAAVAQAEGE